MASLPMLLLASRGQRSLPLKIRNGFSLGNEFLTSKKKKKQHVLCKNIIHIILSRYVGIHVNQLHAVLSAAGSAHAQLFFLSCINSLIKFGWEGGPLWKGK